MRRHHFIFAIIILTMPFFSNCAKENPNNVVPNVYVDVILNINEPSSFNLQPIGGWMYYNGGSNGLIIYHANAEEFKCFDRQSTYNVSDWCQVSIDSTGFVLADTCSGSQFSIFDGSVLRAPATIPLKQYYTTFDGTFITIRN